MLVTELEKEKSALEADKQKSTLTVDENDILKMAKKIEQNENENINFANALDDYVNGKLPKNEVITVGATPNILHIAGAKSNELIITQSVIQNCLNDENVIKHGHSSGHNISLDTLKKLPDSLRNPIIICNGSRENTVVLITSLKNSDDKNVFVPISIDVNGNKGTINKILSAYAKDNLKGFLDKAVENNSIIAYNKEKASELFSITRANSPQTSTITYFDNSIAYTKRNVKGFDKENKRNLIPAKNIEKHTYTAKKPSVLDKLQNLKEQSKSDRPPALAKALHKNLQER